jgi:Uma2 family endonuclease
MTHAMRKLTYTEYLDLDASSDQRFEYVAGVVRAMAGGTAEHSFLSSRMNTALDLALRPHGCTVYGADLRLRIDTVDRTTYADVWVLCGRRIPSKIDRNAYTNPTMIVEVLSPSTEDSDRGDKWQHYQLFPSLREYMLVSQGAPRIEVFSRRESGEWTSRISTAGEWFELPSHGVRIAVDDIYAGFEPDLPD